MAATVTLPRRYCEEDLYASEPCREVFRSEGSPQTRKKKKMVWRKSSRLAEPWTGHDGRIRKRASPHRQSTRWLLESTCLRHPDARTLVLSLGLLLRRGDLLLPRWTATYCRKIILSNSFGMFAPSSSHWLMPMLPTWLFEIENSSLPLSDSAKYGSSSTFYSTFASNEPPTMAPYYEPFGRFGHAISPLGLLSTYYHCFPPNCYGYSP